MAEYVDRFALRDALYDADAITMRGIKIINQFPTAVDAVPVRWIPVTERIPDSQEDVLVVAFWHERWQTMIGWNSDVGKKWRVITPHGELEPGGVTHWMPLPAAEGWNGRR